MSKLYVVVVLVAKVITGTFDKNVKIEVSSKICIVFYVMFLSFYTFIVILIVQVIKNVNVIECRQYRAINNPFRSKAFLPILRNIVKREAINKGTTVMTNVRHDSIEDNTAAFTQLKDVLQQLLNKLNSLDAKPREVTSSPVTTLTAKLDAIPVSPPTLSTSRDFLFNFKKRREGYEKSRWGAWTNWSACSVSCGKGRKIRWRHCIASCDVAETEMEEKACQLPACAPTKFFGIKI